MFIKKYIYFLHWYCKDIYLLLLPISIVSACYIWSKLAAYPFPVQSLLVIVLATVIGHMFYTSTVVDLDEIAPSHRSVWHIRYIVSCMMIALSFCYLLYYTGCYSTYYRFPDLLTVSLPMPIDLVWLTIMLITLGIFSFYKRKQPIMEG